ncbi:Ficolin-1 [Holothuria leucospilota]|uniref:Ficolin-1 n=1 Tax=Holothuria leucospilota TaxID=206669 RepID=A0A9Q1BU78_HOLLE|nr:Ficolin-1 [Holothuria leucospilota]
MESNGGGWTVFQRRVDGTVDFYRNWTSYKQGFGALTHEFWLGNDKIHTLTVQNTYQLRIDVLNPHVGPVYHLYGSFSIGDETDKYRLSVGEEQGKTAGVVGNPLRWNNGRLFSTHDQDNDDTVTYNCAQRHRGAWWYKFVSHYNYYYAYYLCWKWHVENSAHFCSDSNLNGDYQETGVRSTFFWYDWNAQTGCGITRSEMKIRPV